MSSSSMSTAISLLLLTSMSQSAGDRNISVYKAGHAFSSVCAPLCQYTLQTGEDQEWFKVLNEQHTGKAGQSSGALKLGQ